MSDVAEDAVLAALRARASHRDTVSLATSVDTAGVGCGATDGLHAQRVSRDTDATDEVVFALLRQRARARGEALEALRAAEIAAARADQDDDVDPPLETLPQPSWRAEASARRAREVARHLGLPITATRDDVVRAIADLSRPEVRAEMRRRLGP